MALQDPGFVRLMTGRLVPKREIQAEFSLGLFVSFAATDAQLGNVVFAPLGAGPVLGEVFTVFLYGVVDLGAESQKSNKTFPRLLIYL